MSCQNTMYFKTAEKGGDELTRRERCKSCRPTELNECCNCGNNHFFFSVCGSITVDCYSNENYKSKCNCDVDGGVF